MKVVLISWIPLQSSLGLHGSHFETERKWKKPGKRVFLLCECALLPPRTWCSVCALTCPSTFIPALLFWVVCDVTWQHLWELQALSLLTCSVSSLCSSAGKGGGVKLFYFPFPSNTKNLLMRILVKSPKTSKLLKKKSRNKTDQKCISYTLWFWKHLSLTEAILINLEHFSYVLYFHWIEIEEFGKKNPWLSTLSIGIVWRTAFPSCYHM